MKLEDRILNLLAHLVATIFYIPLFILLGLLLFVACVSFSLILLFELALTIIKLLIDMVWFVLSKTYLSFEWVVKKIINIFIGKVE